jgi:hypothetical protein
MAASRFAEVTDLEISEITINSDKYDSHNKCIKESRFEVISTSFSSSNYYRK